MKKLIPFATAMALFGLLFITSCTKEEEPQPNNTDARARFLGNWAASENSKDYGASTYNLTITDSSNASHILISYLYGFNKKTYATVNGNNFTIPAQIIEGNSVTGTGALTSANRIDLSYLVQTTGTHYDTVKVVLRK